MPSRSRLLSPSADGPDLEAAPREAPPGTGTFVDLVEELVSQARRHVPPEDAVLAGLRENLVQEQRERLGERTVRAWWAAPARPRPRVPRQPPPSAVATAGTAAALYDHVMDMLGGRPAGRTGTEPED
ncbi:hypothetical protein [Streptomyces sediminimaris]|uniref:hypothetical protein n=1 Tax=Streptomyces sediminimaris TaxID=3383721 RepID=UPI00399A9884